MLKEMQQEIMRLKRRARRVHTCAQLHERGHLRSGRFYGRQLRSFRKGKDGAAVRRGHVRRALHAENGQDAFPAEEGAACKPRRGLPDGGTVR